VDQARLLTSLLASELEDWYLDANGERLPSEQLFALSPWSAATRDGIIKLVCRFIDLKTGEVIFSVPETYGGEFFSSSTRNGTEHA